MGWKLSTCVTPQTLVSDKTEMPIKYVYAYRVAGKDGQSHTNEAHELFVTWVKMISFVPDCHHLRQLQLSSFD